MIRDLLIKLCSRVAEAYGNNEYPLAAAMGRKPGGIPTIDRGMQVLLRAQWQARAREGAPLPPFHEVEFRAYSQNGEDGILLFLFALLGTTNKRVVEMCCGTGVDCNAANLIINHGFTGALFDGREDLLAMGRRFYSKCRDTYQWPPRLTKAWITPENVNDLISDAGVSGEIDLFSLDMDGVDYWVWKNLSVINPRVVVLEYQDILGPDRCVTAPNDPKFVGVRGKHGTDYGGASLAAFVKLGRAKGYRLVGCEHFGYNAFFLRNDVGADLFPEIPTGACFSHPKNDFGMKERFPAVKDREWVEV